MGRLVNIDFINCPHSEVPKATKLDTSMTLEKIRGELSQCENGESIMKDDMYFCNIGRPYVISRSREANIFLYEILGDNNNLCIKRSKKLEEVMPRLIKEKKLDCGIRWTENGPKQSDTQHSSLPDMNFSQFAVTVDVVLKKVIRNSVKMALNGN